MEIADLARRFGSRKGTWDVLLAMAVAATALAEIWVPFDSVQGSGSRTAASLVAMVACAGIATRRPRPLVCAVLVLVPWPVVSALGVAMPVLFWGQFVPIVVGLYSVARHGTRRQAAIGAGLGAATLLYFDLFVEALGAPGEIVFHWMVSILAWSLGLFVSGYERRAHAQAARAAHAERSGRELALEAVAEERARIARELHDIVAHSVSVMVVQAGAASQALDDRDFVASALDSIRATGTAALGEMRRVVALIREDDQPASLQPQPGLAAVEHLVRGMDVPTELRVEGSPRGLSPGVDLAAYRIVQEALTNVRRHAAATHVQVVLRYAEDEVCVEVVDDGCGTDHPSGGNGLIGMRERVQMYGGTLETRTAPGAGFRVRAVLPAPLEREGAVPA